MVEFTGPSKHFIEQQYLAAMASINVLVSNSDRESAKQLVSAVSAACEQLMQEISAETENA